MLIQKIGGENPGPGRPAECLLGDVSMSPSARGSVPDAQDDKASDFMDDKASDFTDDKASDFTDDTLTNNSDCPGGGGGGGGVGRSMAIRSPVISEGRHSFSSSSSSSSASGGGGDERRHVYQHVRARDNSVQINGDMFSTPSSFRAPNNYYMDVTASGKSWQINGNLDLEPFLELIKVR